VRPLRSVKPPFPALAPLLSLATRYDGNFVSVAPLQFSEKVARTHGKLLVDGSRLGFGNEFLKIWIIADRIPDGVDLQTCNGNDFTGRSRDQLAKYFYGLVRLAGARFDFG